MFPARRFGGGALAVYLDGQPVVDVWTGWSDRRGRLPWTADTAPMVFSATKGMAATVIHRLADRGTEVIMMRLGRNKSDPTGKKKCIKVIEASPQIVKWCLQGLAAPASYFHTWLALRPLGLTPHSGRASAATFLAENYDAEEIRILTAHAGPDDATSTRKYVRPNINHKIAKRMREMTTLIGRSLLPW